MLTFGTFGLQAEEEVSSLGVAKQRLMAQAVGELRAPDPSRAH